MRTRAYYLRKSAISFLLLSLYVILRKFSLNSYLILDHSFNIISEEYFLNSVENYNKYGYDVEELKSNIESKKYKFSGISPNMNEERNLHSFPMSTDFKSSVKETRFDIVNDKINEDNEIKKRGGVITSPLDVGIYSRYGDEEKGNKYSGTSYHGGINKTSTGGFTMTGDIFGGRTEGYDSSKPLSALNNFIGMTPTEKYTPSINELLDAGKPMSLDDMSKAAAYENTYNVDSGGNLVAASAKDAQNFNAQNVYITSGANIIINGNGSTA